MKKKTKKCADNKVEMQITLNGGGGGGGAISWK